MSETSMFFNIFGRDMGVGSMFEGVAHKGQGVTGSLKGIGAAAAELGIVKAGEAAVKSFEDVGKSAYLLRQETGASAEDSSRLGYALSAVGLSAEDTAKPIGIFSKNLVTAQEHMATMDKAKVATMEKTQQEIQLLEHHGVKTEADRVKLDNLKEKYAELSSGMGEVPGALGKLGVAFTDSEGKILPLTELLPEVADKFHEMPDGAEKTALALHLFGKAGAQMIPFLNEGSEAMREQMHASDELGLTLSGEQVDSVHEAMLAQKEWDNTLRGLMVTIGSMLMPVLEGFKEFVRGQLAPAVHDVVGWFKSLSPEMQSWVAIIGTALLVGAPLLLILGKMAGAFNEVIGVVKAMHGAWMALNVVMNANFLAVVVIAIAAFVASLVWAYNNVGWFKDFVDSAWQTIQDIVSNVVNFITGTLVPMLVDGWNRAADMARQVGQWISSTWSDIQSNTSSMVNNVVGFFRSLPGSIMAVFAGAAGWLVGVGSQIMQGLISGVQGMIGNVTAAIQGGVQSAIDGVKGFLGIHSPSTKIADEVGQPMGEGVIVGARRTFGGLSQAMRDMAGIVSGTDLAVAGGGVSLGRTTAAQSPAVYVQNPFTGEYLLGKVDERAGQAISAANDDIFRGRSR